MMSNFSSYPQYFVTFFLDFHVKTRTRFYPRDKRLFEITEVEITKVDCNYLNYIFKRKKAKYYLIATRFCLDSTRFF